MKKQLTVILLAAVATFAATLTFAQDQSAETATGATSLPTPPQAIAQEPTSQAVVPAELMENILAAYSGLSSFSLEFTLAQTIPKKKFNEEIIEKVTEKYLLMFLDENIEDENYMLRLEGIEGYNRRTIVVYAPGKDGEYVYRVFKPALPKGSVLKADNILVRDITKTLPADILSQIDDAVRDPKIEVSASYYPGSNRYLVQYTVEMPYQKKVKPHQVTTYFTGSDYHLISREVRIKMKDDFWFRSTMEWFGFEPGAEITEEDITRVPVFEKD